MDNLEAICANSFRNFHTRGLDYLCLQRSESLTVKAYFFEGDLSKLPEIVVPHDHRYPFTTQVLAGKLANKTYSEHWQGDVFQRFAYRTPLLGGDGFTWDQEVRLHSHGWEEYERGATYHCLPTDVHTLDIMAEGTVAVLYQFADTVPIGVPTWSYRPGAGTEPPSMEGLYDRMRPDDALTRLRQLRDLGFVS